MMATAMAGQVLERDESQNLPNLMDIRERVGPFLGGIRNEGANEKEWTDGTGRQLVRVGDLAYNTVEDIVEDVKNVLPNLGKPEIIEHLKEVFSDMSSDPSNEEYEEVGKKCFNALIWLEHDPKFTKSAS